MLLQGASHSSNHPTAENLIDWTPDLSSVSKLLLDVCLSQDQQEVIYGCQGISTLMSSVVSEGQKMSSDTKSKQNSGSVQSDNYYAWTADISALIIRQLEGMNQTNVSYDLEVESNDSLPKKRLHFDPSVPLLSMLYDLVCVHKDTHAFNIPSTVVSQGFHKCYEICCSATVPLWLSRQGRLLALRCAILLLSIATLESIQAIKLNIDNAVNSNEESFDNGWGICLENEFSQYEPSDDSAHDENLKSIILEVLHRRLKDDDFIGGKCLESSPHMHNAVESEEISSFPVDDHPTQDKKLEGCWLCEDMVLSLRIGHKNTRYRGWLEVIIRSPTSRSRRLLRLPDHISVGNPNTPTSLWYPPSIRNAQKLDHSDIDIEETSEALLKAKSVMDRYHLIVGERLKNTNINIQKLQKPSISSRAESHINVRTTRSTNTPPPFDLDADFESDVEDKSEHHDRNLEEKRVNKTIEYEEELKDDFPPTSALRHRPFSDSDLCLHEFRPRSNNVYKFLEESFGKNSKNLKSTIDTLLDMGFTDSAIGIPYHPEIESNTSLSNTIEAKMQPLIVSPKLQRAINILDRTSHFQTHKIGLMFIDSAVVSEDAENGSVYDNINGNDNIGEIYALNDKHGSPGFLEFAKDLGSFVLSRHLKYFSGGLDTSSYASDGEFALIHMSDDTDCDGRRFKTGGTMMLFHTLPLMPLGINNRKKHVGNDYVHIVYLERVNNKYNYNIEEQDSVVGGQFSFVTIYVMPLLASEGMKITVKIRSGLDDKTYSTLSHLAGTTMLSRGPTAARYIRQLAARADLACRSIQEDRIGLFSNWEERLIQIREMKRYVL